MYVFKEGNVNKWLFNIASQIVESLGLVFHNNVNFEGDGIAGAIAQCCYLALCKKGYSGYSTIRCFDPPKIGNSVLRYWFESRPKLHLTNFYNFTVDKDHIRRPKSLTYYPLSFEYNFNPNPKMIFNGKEYGDADVYFPDYPSFCGIFKDYIFE